MASNGRPVDPGMVLAALADVTHVTLSEMRSQVRTQHVARARKVGYRLLYDLCELSWPAVGEYLARDHSTCITGASRADRKLCKTVAAEVEWRRTR